MSDIGECYDKYHTALQMLVITHAFQFIKQDKILRGNKN